MLLLNCLGVATNLRILTVILCELVDKGGRLFFFAHMLYESAGNEASATAAAIICMSVGAWIASIFLTMFAKSMLLSWVLMLVAVLVTIWLAQRGLPTMNHVKYG
jgi:hypothetical protein